MGTTNTADASIRALTEGAGLLELVGEARVSVTGRHRARFVHNMTTFQVKTLQPGQGGFGMTVDRSGKLVAQMLLECEEERLVLQAPGPHLAAIEAHLIGHRVADDVHFAPADEACVLALSGPQSAAVVARALGSEPGLDAPFSFRDVQLGGVGARLRNNAQRLLAPGFDVIVAPGDRDAAVAALTEAGAVLVDAAAWEVVRVSRGVPADGIDMDSANIPLESQVLYDTVDWDKGCYIGQEVIAMMHYRGRPNRHLVGLALPEGQLPAPHTPITSADGKEAGRTGTALSHPYLGGAVALAVIKRKHSEPGTQLTLPDGRQVTVRALPLLA